MNGATEPNMEFAEAEADLRRARELARLEDERHQQLREFREKEFSSPPPGTVGSMTPKHSS